jgi:alpha-methylacyl-CoA racemase
VVLGDGLSGPLSAIRVLEFSGLGPTPFAAMMLADMGADILRIDRPDKGESLTQSKGADTLFRGRPSLTLDLKDRDQAAAARALARHADVVVEGYRPGVMEHLGLGPDVLIGDHPALIYARITGWGQKGPLARSAGHDINYISLTGALLAIGTEGEPPPPPLNLLGDFGAGGMMAVAGILAALVERQSSGRGQVVDAAMVDGAASLLSLFHGLAAGGQWDATQRAANLLDGGAPFYGTYRCADGKWLAVGPIEPQFHDVLIEKLGLAKEDFAERWDAASWPRLRALLESAFAGRTRDAWVALLEHTDACVAPVLDLDEAPRHPHNVARQTFVEHDGITQPAPAPRFSRSQVPVPPAPPERGQGGKAALADWGFDAADIKRLTSLGLGTRE